MYNFYSEKAIILYAILFVAILIPIGFMIAYDILEKKENYVLDKIMPFIPCSTIIFSVIVLAITFVIKKG